MEILALLSISIDFALNFQFLFILHYIYDYHLPFQHDVHLKFCQILLQNHTMWLIQMHIWVRFTRIANDIQLKHSCNYCITEHFYHFSWSCFSPWKTRVFAKSDVSLNCTSAGMHQCSVCCKLQKTERENLSKPCVLDNCKAK